MSDDQTGEPGGAGGRATGPGAGDAAGGQAYASTLNDQGVWFVTAGRPHLAVRCFRRACAAWPGLTVAWTNLAATLAMLGRSREAMAAIRGAIQAGALTRSAAARHRAAIRQKVSPEQLVAHRHPVPPEGDPQDRVRRPPARRPPGLPRTAVTIYPLLRTAAYDMNCEKRIPAA